MHLLRLVQAEDVAELPRLLRGAGLRFEGFLDLFLISHKLDNVNGVRCQRPTPAQRVCRGFKQ